MDERQTFKCTWTEKFISTGKKDGSVLMTVLLTSTVTPKRSTKISVPKTLQRSFCGCNILKMIVSIVVEKDIYIQKKILLT